MQGRPICHTLPVMRVKLVSGPDMCLNFDSGIRGSPWISCGKFRGQFETRNFPHKIKVPRNPPPPVPPTPLREQQVPKFDGNNTCGCSDKGVALAKGGVQTLLVSEAWQCSNSCHAAAKSKAQNPFFAFSTLTSDVSTTTENAHQPNRYSAFLLLPPPTDPLLHDHH